MNFGDYKRGCGGVIASGSALGAAAQPRLHCHVQIFWCFWERIIGVKSSRAVGAREFFAFSVRAMLFHIRVFIIRRVFIYEKYRNS